MPNAAAVCLVLAGAAVALPSQSTHLVGPGGLPQIRDALAIAAAGDTILVQPGTYAHFAATVGVQIRAATPGTVLVRWDQAFVPGCSGNPFCVLTEGATQLMPPVGQTLTLVGLTFPPTATTVFGGQVRNRLEVLGGRVVLDGCIVESVAPHALAVANATVHLLGGECRAIPPTLVPFGTTVALRGSNSSITAVGTRFVGSSSYLTSSGAAGEAILLSGCTLTATAIDAEGGRILLGGTSASAVRADGGVVRLSDSVVLSGGTDACALVGSANFGVARCSFGAAGPNCQTPPSAALLGLAPPSTPTPGQSYALQWNCDPNALVGVLWSLELATRPLPIFSQPWWAPANSPTAGLFVADAQGRARGAWLLPNTPTLVGVSIWFHSFSGTNLPLSAAPPVGGVIR
ncbi:MAG: hypothetical protein RL398_3651 [Planctomycetota bacterium]|jgi:hypothetical protein